MILWRTQTFTDPANASIKRPCRSLQRNNLKVNMAVHLKRITLKEVTAGREQDALPEQFMKPDNSFNKLASALWADDDFAFQAKAQDVAIKLASVVNHSGFNQAQLAEKLGWKASRMSRILTGNTNLTIKTIYQICHAIDLDFDVVLRRLNEKTLVVDKDYQHAEASSNLVKSKVLLDTATELNRRAWKYARETQRFNHPEYTNQPLQAQVL